LIEYQLAVDGSKIRVREQLPVYKKSFRNEDWIPAFAGMTKGSGMTRKGRLSYGFKNTPKQYSPRKDMPLI
jgi:hypothetical protein